MISFIFPKFPEESCTKTAAFRQATNGADKERSNAHHQMTQTGIDHFPPKLCTSNVLPTELFDALNMVNVS